MRHADENPIRSNRTQWYAILTQNLVVQEESTSDLSNHPTILLGIYSITAHVCAASLSSPYAGSFKG